MLHDLIIICKKQIKIIKLNFKILISYLYLISYYKFSDKLVRPFKFDKPSSKF
jgi:hypothetical protein